MKKQNSLFTKFLKIFCIFIIFIILILGVTRTVGIHNNRVVPDNGINETAYVDVNGTKEWISIYSQNKDNPVLLVLHGGPGSSQSLYAYEYQKAWGSKYTVVTWDQRGCGLSYDDKLNAKDITFDLMMSDSLQVVNYVRSYLGVDKITLLGYSWGTMLGSRLAYKYPQYFDAYIAAGQVVDTYENEVEFIKEAEIWAKDDSDGLKMVQQLTPANLGMNHYELKSEIMSRYGHATHSNGYGFNYYKAVYFNPYYSIADIYNCLTTNVVSQYKDFINSDDFNKFSLSNQMDYQLPYYFICGDDDYQTNYHLAKKYYEQIKAPKKEYFLIKNCTHGLMEEKTDKFTDILMQIADMQFQVK